MTPSSHSDPGRGGRPRAASGLHKTEGAILALHDAGVTRRQIEESGQFSQESIKRAYGLMSETGSINQVRNIRDGSDTLGKRIDFVAGAKAFADSYIAARQLAATAKNVFTIDKPVPVLRRAAAERLRLGEDPRPFAASREPCRLCQTRGDLGCAHQRPFETLSGGDAA